MIKGIHIFLDLLVVFSSFISSELIAEGDLNSKIQKAMILLIINFNPFWFERWQAKKPCLLPYPISVRYIMWDDNDNNISPSELSLLRLHHHSLHTFYSLLFFHCHLLLNSFNACKQDNSTSKNMIWRTLAVFSNYSGRHPRRHESKKSLLKKEKCEVYKDIKIYKINWSYPKFEILSNWSFPWWAICYKVPFSAIKMKNWARSLIVW